MKRIPRIPCPICWAEEIRAAGREQRHPQFDSDHGLMIWWASPGGARDQTVGRHLDNSYWHCEACDLVLTPLEAALLLDTILPRDTYYDKTVVDIAARGGNR